MFENFNSISELSFNFSFVPPFYDLVIKPERAVSNYSSCVERKVVSGKCWQVSIRDLYDCQGKLPRFEPQLRKTHGTNF